MEIILSKQCESLTGSLGRGFGYYIRSTKKGRYFSQRSKHSVPPGGHWRFILTCAQLAQNKLHIVDIKVKWIELRSALFEAKLLPAVGLFCKKFYDARDILNLKNKFNL